ncbi:MAG: hypothetical protein Q9183_004842 [Haloplaca sp. 2 TL-2023]
MSSGSKLDQIVKGAAPPGTSVPSVVPPAPIPSIEADDANAKPGEALPQTSDPTASLPSSPPQIYLNLLILEASLRSQYLTLRARRRQHTFFLLLLAAWIAGFSYALFLRPREDGSGVGGSVYWVVETSEKVALLGGIVTGILLWGTGQWDRGVRWPRRWVGIANRGLRNINAKIVIIKGPWWKELFGPMAFLFPFSFTKTHEELYHLMEPVVEDLTPGGDYLKLLLLPKPFSPDFRENWDMYRLEYWEKENERRAQLRRQLVELSKKLAREEGKWLWWTGWRRPKRASTDIEKFQVAQTEKGPKQRRRSFIRADSHSRNTSRSSTPASFDGEEKPGSSRSRRGSSNHANSSERRKKLRAAGSPDLINVAELTALHSGPGATSS